MTVKFEWKQNCLFNIGLHTVGGLVINTQTNRRMLGLVSNLNVIKLNMAVKLEISQPFVEINFVHMYNIYTLHLLVNLYC